MRFEMWRGGTVAAKGAPIFRESGLSMAMSVPVEMAWNELPYGFLLLSMRPSVICCEFGRLRLLCSAKDCVAKMDAAAADLKFLFTKYALEFLLVTAPSETLRCGGCCWWFNFSVSK